MKLNDWEHQVRKKTAIEIYGKRAGLSPAWRKKLKDNLSIVNQFIELTKRDIETGYGSARHYVQIIRHESPLRESGSTYKINDHFSAPLAALCESLFDLNGFFRMKSYKARTND